MDKSGYHWGNRNSVQGAKNANYMDGIKMDAKQYDEAMPTRRVTTWEHAAMRKKGWTKERSQSNLQDYLSLGLVIDYDDPVNK